MFGVYFLLYVYPSRLLSEHSDRERSFLVTSCCFCCQERLSLVRPLLRWTYSDVSLSFYFLGSLAGSIDLVGYFHINEVTVFNTPKTSWKHTADEDCPSTLFSLFIRFPYLCCAVSRLHRYEGLNPGVLASIDINCT